MLSVYVIYTYNCGQKIPTEAILTDVLYFMMLIYQYHCYISELHFHSNHRYITDIMLNFNKRYIRCLSFYFVFIVSSIWKRRGYEMFHIVKYGKDIHISTHKVHINRKEVLSVCKLGNRSPSHSHLKVITVT